MPEIEVKKLSGFTQLCINGQAFAEIYSNGNEKPTLWLCTDAGKAVKNIQYSQSFFDRSLLEAK